MIDYNVFVLFFHCLTLNSFNGEKFDFCGTKIRLWQHGSIKFAYVVPNRISYLVGPGVGMCFCQVSAAALAKKVCFLK